MRRFKHIACILIICAVFPSLIAFFIAAANGKLPYQKNSHTEVYYIYELYGDHGDRSEYAFKYQFSKGKQCLQYGEKTLILIGKRYGPLGLGVRFPVKSGECP